MQSPPPSRTVQSIKTKPGDSALKARGTRRMSADRRRTQIVQAAQTLMIDSGYSSVTLRAVATACGVSLAAVQHFYPDKTSLYTAMIGGMTSHMDSVYQEISGRRDHDQPRLTAFLRFLLFEDITDRNTAGFFYELWSLAHREPIAARALASLYEQQLTRLTDLVLDTSPTLDATEAARRAAIIMAATDGLMMTIGYGKTVPAELQGAGREQLLTILVGIADHG